MVRGSRPGRPLCRSHLPAGARLDARRPFPDRARDRRQRDDLQRDRRALDFAVGRHRSALARPAAVDRQERRHDGVRRLRIRAADDRRPAWAQLVLLCHLPRTGGRRARRRGPVRVRPLQPGGSRRRRPGRAGRGIRRLGQLLQRPRRRAASGPPAQPERRGGRRAASRRHQREILVRAFRRRSVDRRQGDPRVESAGHHHRRHARRFHRGAAAARRSAGHHVSAGARSPDARQQRRRGSVLPRSARGLVAQHHGTARTRHDQRTLTVDARRAVPADRARWLRRLSAVAERGGARPT